ncbi:unnamed protein product [Chrysodeixis includens]|uniref:Uncharacterized protein n=1 Tax=Chrysodeixis includens TaxID=689277 RepID=A0A9N8L0X5_CHRIL|nr:unnamed protein product [Chrysodeixis includens]
MAAKAIVLFASAFFVQSITCQCIGSLNNINPGDLALNSLAYNNMASVPGLAYNNIVGPGLAYPGLGFTPSTGVSFAVTSSSPISPTGIMVFSENAIEGALVVNGELPFLGAIAVEGTLPTAGAGGINYGCGSGNIGMASEGVNPATLGLGYGPGFAGPSLGMGPVPYNGLPVGRPCGAVF